MPTHLPAHGPGKATHLVCRRHEIQRRDTLRSHVWRFRQLQIPVKNNYVALYSMNVQYTQMIAAHTGRET